MASAWDSSHAPAVPWTSGPWSLELRDDELADLTFDGRRVLRSIRAVVRDRDWNTAPFAVEQVTAAGDVLEVIVSTTALGSDIRGAVRAVAGADGLEVTFEATSATDFPTNRTGLVVLHPYQVAGEALEVVHPDGTVESTRFPSEISPHQPVLDISGLAWHDDGLAVSVGFEGDVFEMEDQRNWTDASFKTYSRPLALPFPYLLAAGERVRQSVSVAARAVSPARRAVSRGVVSRGVVSPSVADDPSADGADRADRIVLRPGGTFPLIGVGASTAPGPAPAMSPPGDELLVELDLASPTWRAALARAAASGLPLDVRFVLAGAGVDVGPDAGAGADGAADADSVVEGAEALRGLRIARVSAFWAEGEERHVSDVTAIALLRRALDAAGVEAPIVGGVRSHFTELNREQHRLPSDLDGIVFGVTPLFHSLGTEQLVESLAIQRLAAAQAVRIAAGVPVHIGPVTLRPHFNDVATTPAPVASVSDLSEGYGPHLIAADDARQTSPELAAWTVASAAALAVPGVASLSFFEEWGPRGIRSPSGDDLPGAVALRTLVGLTGAELLWGDSPDGLVWAVGARAGDSATVLVANLDRRAREITIEIESFPAPVDAVVGALSFAQLDLSSA